METEKKITNTNTNTNNINVNVNVEHPQTKSSKKESKPNWYMRAILGGLIALALSLLGFYLKNKMGDDKSKASTTMEQNVQPIIGKKSN